MTQIYCPQLLRVKILRSHYVRNKHNYPYHNIFIVIPHQKSPLISVFRFMSRRYSVLTRVLPSP